MSTYVYTACVPIAYVYRVLCVYTSICMDVYNAMHSTAHCTMEHEIAHLASKAQPTMYNAMRCTTYVNTSYVYRVHVHRGYILHVYICLHARMHIHVQRIVRKSIAYV